MANNVTVALGCNKHCKVDINSMIERFKPLPSKLLSKHGAGTIMKSNPYVEKGMPSEPRRKLRETLHLANRQWKNNVQFEDAANYLQDQGVLPPFSRVIESHYSERDKACYLPSEEKDNHCSMLACSTDDMHTSSNGPVMTSNNTLKYGR